MNTENARANWHTTTEIRHANAAAGEFFFNPDAMRFFRSKVHEPPMGGRYFVTSEQYKQGTARRFAIREAQPNGEIESVSPVLAYRTLGAARAAVRLILAFEGMS